MPAPRFAYRVRPTADQRRKEDISDRARGAIKNEKACRRENPSFDPTQAPGKKRSLHPLLTRLRQLPSESDA